MAGETKVTIDHEEIRRWVESRGGKPARVIETGGDSDPGILRIDFPGDGDDESLEPISWDEWFEWFDRNNLAFVYQDEKASGESSTFNKLVARETANA
jgi:hypothetical protein